MVVTDSTNCSTAVLETASGGWNAGRTRDGRARQAYRRRPVSSTGFETLIEFDKAPKGLSEDTVRFISGKEERAAWMLEWRLEAYRRWLTMTEPTWARVNYPQIDYQDLYYYSAPKPKKQIGSLDEIDPEILKTYEKLGIPLRGSRGARRRREAGRRAQRSRSMPCSISVSVATTFQKELKAACDLHADLGSRSANIPNW